MKEFVDTEFTVLQTLCQIQPQYRATRRHHHPPHLDSLLWLQVVLGIVSKCVLLVCEALRSARNAHISELASSAVLFLKSSALPRPKVSVLSPAAPLRISSEIKN